MADMSVLRRIRAAAVGAVLSGAGWFATAFVLATGMWAAGMMQEGYHPLDSLLVAARFGFVGTFAGGLFSLLIGFLYDGKGIADIRMSRFAGLGALAGGVFVVGWVTIPRALGGESLLPLTSILRNGMLAAVIGGTVAAVTLGIAKYADRKLPYPHDDILEDDDLLGSGSLADQLATSRNSTVGQRRV